MTSKELKWPQMTSLNPKQKTKSNKRNKNNLKGGSIHDNFENNDRYSDEILDNNDK